MGNEFCEIFIHSSLSKHKYLFFKIFVGKYLANSFSQIFCENLFSKYLTSGRWDFTELRMLILCIFYSVSQEPHNFCLPKREENFYSVLKGNLAKSINPCTATRNLFTRFRLCTCEGKLFTSGEKINAHCDIHKCAENNLFSVLRTNEIFHFCKRRTFHNNLNVFPT